MIDLPPPDKTIGIIGKTNVGKSTLFAAATLSPVEIENRPFVTLSPHVGIGYVRVTCIHKKLGLSSCNPQKGFCEAGWRFIPVKLVDIPGLIPGAHEGKGLGNKFLDSIRQADANIFIVDAAGSTDAQGNPVPPGTYNPVEEILWLERELDEWITGIIISDWDRFSRKVSVSGVNPIDALAQRLSGLSISKENVQYALEYSDLTKKPLVNWTNEDIKRFAQGLRKSKPIVVAANKIDLPQAEDNIKKMQKTLKDYTIVPISALAELVLRKASRAGLIEYLPGDSDFRILDEKKLTSKQLRGLEYIKENVLRRWGSTGVQELINKVVLEKMRMIIVYPVDDPTHYTDTKGNILPDAYLVPKGTTARDLAYMIHTDLGENFLYAIDATKSIRISAEQVLDNNSVIKIVATTRKLK